MTRIDPHRDITGLVLAGGRGTRMNGLDKGLQYFEDEPLALRALQRLVPQVSTTLLNANRNMLTYEFFGAPVLADDTPDFPGPLAGLLVGLAHCKTPWLLTVPCDAPRFPLDMAQRLADALSADGADIAMASAPEKQTDGSTVMRAQPVFALVRASLRDSLEQFMKTGGRKVLAWMARHRTVQVSFDQPGDAPDAFANANTLAELHALERT
jgi:molybdopterin-guanine dinucleotide biosynthesis protein A